MATLREIAASLYRRTFGTEPNETQVQALSTWIATERGRPLDSGIFLNNPLNVTLTPQEAAGPFSTSWVPKGAGGADSAVRAFQTLDDGIAANAKRLWDASYANIRATLQALGNGGGLDQFWNALRASPWAGNRYAGSNFTSTYQTIDLTLPWGGATTGGTAPSNSDVAAGVGGVKLDPKPSMGGVWTGGATTPAKPGTAIGNAQQAATQAQAQVKSWWDGVGSFFDVFKKFFESGLNWRRIGLFLLGAFLILTGIVLYVQGWLPNQVNVSIPGVGGK